MNGRPKSPAPEPHDGSGHWSRLLREVLETGQLSGSADPQFHEIVSRRCPGATADEQATLARRLAALPRDALPEFAHRPTDFILGWHSDFERGAHDHVVASPAADTLRPLARIMLDQVRDVAASCDAVSITESAWHDLNADAMRLLDDVAAQPLLMTSTLDRYSGAPGTRPISLAAACKLYPALRDVLDTVMRTWPHAASLLIQRLHADSEVLLQFGRKAESGPLTIDGLRCGLSDRHDGGTTVVRVTDATGWQVFYKPRPVGMELAYNRLLDWLNSRRPMLLLQSLRVLDRGAWGWTSAVAARPCANRDQARRYYFRAGSLAALCWVLGTTDMHQGNIVCSGEHPVLIDSETCLSDESTAPSLDRMCFLPRIESCGGFRFDITGLGGSGGATTDRRVPVRTRPGSQAEQLRYEPARLKPQSNVLSIDQQRQRAARYATSIEEGFRNMVDLLMRERIGLLDAAGPITPMGAAVRRLVPRHTRTYYLALNSSLQVRHLRNSSVRRSAIEDCLGGNSTTDEVTSLMELEIPRASCPPQSTQVVSDRLHLLGPELTDAQLTEFRSNLVGTLLQGWTTR